MKRGICLGIALVIALVHFDIKQPLWRSLSEQERNDAPVEIKAYIAGMTTEEFKLISAVVEAESDRSDSLEGKELIALTILNRVESDNFPNTIKGVIAAGGQFQVYEQGIYKQVGRTDTSDEAVIEASFWIKTEHPAVVYFNSIGYNYLGTPYAYVDGNYFETEEADND